MFIRYEEAESDCTEALNLDDHYVKAYSRRATARKELGKLKAALEGIENCHMSVYPLITFHAYSSQFILFLHLLMIKFLL